MLIVGTSLGTVAFSKKGRTRAWWYINGLCKDMVCVVNTWCNSGDTKGSTEDSVQQEQIRGLMRWTLYGWESPKRQQNWGKSHVL